MSIDISSRFNYEQLFRFVLPSVVMMIFISTYTMVDGFFVSNYVGKTAFTAVNLIFPAIMVLPVSDSCSAQAAAPLWQRPWVRGKWKKRTVFFLSSSFLLLPEAYCFPPWVISLCPFLLPPWAPPVKCLRAVSFTAAHFFFPSPCLSSSGYSNRSWSPPENLLSVSV